LIRDRLAVAWSFDSNPKREIQWESWLFSI
jgi:hypothetical protein